MFLRSPPHPSPLPFHLHRFVFLRIPDPSTALSYARSHLISYVPTQPVLQLLTSSLYPSKPTDLDADDSMSGETTSPYQNDPAPLVAMFRAEFCRRHGWAKEEPLGVVVDLGSRGGALNVIEKARRVMGDHLGQVRTWQELPVRSPSPASEFRLELGRWRSPCRHHGDIIRSSSVRCRRNKRPSRIRQRCLRAGILSPRRASIGCSREGRLYSTFDWTSAYKRIGEGRQSAHTARWRPASKRHRGCTSR